MTSRTSHFPAQTMNVGLLLLMILICLFCLASCDGAARVRGTIVNEMGAEISNTCTLELYFLKNNELIRRMKISSQFDRDFTISPTYHKYYMIIQCEDYSSHHKTEVYKMGGSKYIKDPIDLGTIVLEQRNAKENNIKKFNKLYSEWQDYIAKVAYNSYSEPYINCKPYQEIIKIDKPIVPYIIEKMEEGKISGWKETEFFLWYAVRDITGVDLVKQDEALSEQDMAEKYINWWKQKEK